MGTPESVSGKIETPPITGIEMGGVALWPERIELVERINYANPDDEEVFFPSQYVPTVRE